MPRKRKVKKANSIVTINQRAASNLPPAKHEPGKKRALVIDGMHMAYRAHFVHRRFRFNGRPTGIIYGMVSMIKSLIQLERPDKVVVCWDGLKHPERLKILPTYKGHRESSMTPKDRKAFYKQIARLRVLLHALGIPQAHNESVEGDDMVYLVCKQLVSIYPITIVSGDKDFKQLINKDISLLNPNQKYADCWQDFYLHSGIEIHQFVDYLCMVGDDSDDIPGYRGIGDVRAKKFLSQFGSVRNFIRTKGAEFTGVSDKKALKKIWKRNRKLIDLPRFCNKHYTAKDVTYYKGRHAPDYNESKVMELCAKYGLKTFRGPVFQQVFKSLQE